MNAVVQFESLDAKPGHEASAGQLQSLQIVGRLVSGVAHDFNNVLTGIALYCDLILQGLEPEGSLHRYADEIHQACEHGAELVQQLMAVARQEQIEARVLSWDEVIAGLQYLLARLIGENIEVVTTLDSQAGKIRIAPSQAQQIVLNLILNARDAMPQGGRITLETRTVSAATRSSEPVSAGIRYSELLVSDTGTGIDAAVQSRLGQPFVTTKKRGRGTGLGLAMVYGIAQQQGGSVNIESSPQTGTAVRVRLPLAAESKAAKASG